MIPVVVTCNPDEPRWREDFSESLRLTWPADFSLPKVRYFDGWELEALKWAARQDFDRFLLLQDSTVIKHWEFWVEIDAFSDKSALLMPRPNCYMGIYEKSVLEETFNTPDRYFWEIRGETAVEKKEYALYYEKAFIDRYFELAGGMPVIFDDLTDQNAKEVVFRYDKDRLVLENCCIRKYKGTWTGKFGYYKGQKP